MPGRFSQLPNTHRFPRTHSSTSGGGPQLSAAQPTWHPAPVTPSASGSRDPPTPQQPQTSPWQACWSSVGLKPISHSQRYPPGALRHCPFSQRSTFSAHSSLSKGTQRQRAGGQLARTHSGWAGGPCHSNPSVTQGSRELASSPGNLEGR